VGRQTIQEDEDMPRTARPNIAFAGLTAAGKTTHAKILAEQLGYEVVSATALLLDILGSKANPEKVWFTEYETIEKAREDDRVDRELERRLGVLAESKDGLILDSWAMAYIYEGPLIRLWIESDQESRTRKCYVSQGQKKVLDLSACRQLIQNKDHRVRSQFLRRLKFDLFTDMSRYDAVIENTNLIAEPTDRCSRAGIKTFAPVVHDVVRYLAHQALHTASMESVQSLQAKYGAMVQKVNEKPWSFSS
jgi:cytidylate kinase